MLNLLVSRLINAPIFYVENFFVSQGKVWGFSVCSGLI